MTSTSRTTCEQTPGSRMSPSQKSIWSMTSCRFLVEPVERLSTTRTGYPSSNNRVTRWDPMKPAPPVTRIPFRVIRNECEGRGPADEFQVVERSAWEVPEKLTIGGALRCRRVQYLPFF